MQTYKNGILLPINYANKAWIDNVKSLTQSPSFDFVNYWTNNYEFINIRKGMDVYFICETFLVGRGRVLNSFKGKSIENCFNDYGVKNGLTTQMKLNNFVNMINTAFTTKTVLTKDDPIGCVLLEDVNIYEESNWKKHTNQHGVYF